VDFEHLVFEERFGMSKLTKKSAVGGGDLGR